jgi:hypothetical protein
VNKIYKIYLKEIFIGTSRLEKADVPMGVVFGKITWIDDKFGYDFFKKFCLENKIELVYDFPKDKMISTMSIAQLKVTSENGIEIMENGNQISGMDTQEYEITISGIPSTLLNKEFPHHIEQYNNLFN